MREVNGDAIKAGLLVGSVALVVLFVGQILSFTVRWVSRALSGGIIVLLAIVAGYAAYELYSGWSAAEDTTDSKLERSQESHAEETATRAQDGDSVSDQEIDEELEALIEETRETTNNPTREVE